MRRLLRAIVLSCVATCASAATLRVADCVRDPALDSWAASDARFCAKVMAEVIAKACPADTTIEHVPYGFAGMAALGSADVVLSTFRTVDIKERFNFAVQPLCRMHYALYASPDRAEGMMATKITDWPRMRVGYSPVSQGRTDDRERYFERANLSPDYVEYATSEGAVDALHSGEIDALFLYTPIGRRPEGVVEIVPLGDRDVVFAVRKDNPDLFTRLSAAYRDIYIDRVAEIDAWREEMLGVPRPQKRVRVAAYCRGGLFTLDEDGASSGPLSDWLRAIAMQAGWQLNYVYGTYYESLEDVKNGRLDIIAGLGITPTRRRHYLFPHTPIGMLRSYLWAHPGGPCKPGVPHTWRGIKVGILAKTFSGEKARRQISQYAKDVTVVEFISSEEMLAAYFGGGIDACVDVEQPQFADEIALHAYTAHPIYVCTSRAREDLYYEMETALDEICEDFPKYQRMIEERHYGARSDIAALSIEELEWLTERRKDRTPVVIDFSPWPMQVCDEDSGKPVGFVASFLGELSRRTGLNFVPAPPTGIQNAEARFMRGDTELWIPFPERPGAAAYGALSVFALPVPQTSARLLGLDPANRNDLELFAKSTVPRELTAIIRKIVTDMDTSHIQEMLMTAIADSRAEMRIFGLTADQFKSLLYKLSFVVLAVFAVLGVIVGVLLKRQATMAKESARIAEEHAQSRTRFLAMMSHELRTPLNAVIGFAEFLSREGIDEARRKEYTEGILLSSNALLELVNDVLDLSKLDAGAMVMREGVCDVNLLLKELPAIFGYRVRRHGIALRVEVKGNAKIPAVKLSRQGLRQILINLVGNAAKFTEHGEIAVEVAWFGMTRTLHIEVSDTGVGMTDEKMSRLFDPFVQDISSRMKQNAGEVKGTGLGLPIVKRMVEAASGTITAESEIGKGTRFTIDIPELEIVEVAESNGAAAKPINLKTPDRVLVVDDMVMNRKVLGIHLSNLNIKDVRFAENGVEALKIMADWLPELVFTDMWMPEMDGSQLAQAMHADARLAEIPVVAVTADVEAGSTYDVSLFTKVMSKPVTTGKLKALFGQDQEHK